MRSEGYSSRSVCVSVCVSPLILALQATRWPMSDTNGFKTTRTWKNIRRFSWNDGVREICREKSEKANMHNRAGLPRTDLPTPRTLEAQEVTTEGVYRLPHAIY